MQQLQYKLHALNQMKRSSMSGDKPIGCGWTGLRHVPYGHMNAFRLGRSHGTHLVVGVNSDIYNKVQGDSPVMNDAERLAAVAGCKFVDEVVEDVPYVMTADYLAMVVEKYKIDYVVHGDDPCIVDGKDVYEIPKRKGFYRSIPRTEGVSTTDIVGRMLLVSGDHHDKLRNTEASRSR